MQIGFLQPANFVVPHNPIVGNPPGAPLAGNSLLGSLTRGCRKLPCRANLNGLGEFEILGATVPGSQWMYLLGVGLLAGIYFMSGRRRRA